jgi:hypothetical protein
MHHTGTHAPLSTTRAAALPAARMCAESQSTGDCMQLFRCMPGRCVVDRPCRATEAAQAGRGGWLGRALGVGQVAVVQVDGVAQGLDVGDQRARGVQRAQLLRADPCRPQHRPMQAAAEYPSAMETALAPAPCLPQPPLGWLGRSGPASGQCQSVRGSPWAVRHVREGRRSSPARRPRCCRRAGPGRCPRS